MRLLFTGFAGSAEKFDEKMDAVNPNSLLHLENIKKWQLEREERFKKEEIEKRYFKPSSEAYVKQEGSASLSSRREPIPTKVRREVWKRDGGKCVKCGSQEKLEFDHIIPLSKKGSNTARNIELLCEKCNRSKGGSII